MGEEFLDSQAQQAEFLRCRMPAGKLFQLEGVFGEFWKGMGVVLRMALALLEGARMSRSYRPLKYRISKIELIIAVLALVFVVNQLSHAIEERERRSPPTEQEGAMPSDAADRISHP